MLGVTTVRPVEVDRWVEISSYGLAGSAMDFASR